MTNVFGVQPLLTTRDSYQLRLAAKWTCHTTHTKREQRITNGGLHQDSGSGVWWCNGVMVWWGVVVGDVCGVWWWVIVMYARWSSCQWGGLRTEYSVSFVFLTLSHTTHYSLTLTHSRTDHALTHSLLTHTLTTYDHNAIFNSCEIWKSVLCSSVSATLGSSWSDAQK